MRIAALLLILLVASTMCATASAQETVAPTASAHDDEARALFEAAELAYADGRYEDALEHFERSYALSQRPQLLYNVALAAERLRHDQRALEAYEGYLAATPDAPNRTAIESRIAILREAIDEHVTAPPSDVEAPHEAVPPDPVAPPPAGGPEIGGIVLAIGGGAVLIAGAVLAGLAAADTATVQAATFPSNWTDFHGAYDRAFSFSVAGWTLVGIGAAALVGGIVWIAVGGSSTHAEVAIGPGSLSLRGTF